MSVYTAHKEGKEDFKRGLKFWENPYCKDNDDIRAAPAWFAGWCLAKQEKVKRDKEQEEKELKKLGLK